MDIKKYVQSVIDSIAADADGDRQEVIKALNAVSQALARVANSEFQSLAADSMAFAKENLEAFKNFKPAAKTASEFLASRAPIEPPKE